MSTPNQPNPPGGTPYPGGSQIPTPPQGIPAQPGISPQYGQQPGSAPQAPIGQPSASQIPSVPPQSAGVQGQYPPSQPQQQGGNTNFYTNPLGATQQYPGYPGQPDPLSPAPKKSKKWLWITLAAVAFLLVIVLVLVFATGKPKNGTSSSAGGKAADSKTSAALSEPELAKKTAQDYFNALAEGRGNDAAKMLDVSTKTDSSLLTDDVLKDSLKRAKITDIEVGEPNGSYSSYTVSVKYKLGDKPGGADLHIRIDKATSAATIDYGATSSLYIDQLMDVKPLINGVAPSTKSPTIFPGSYDIKLGTPYLEVKGTNPYVLDSLTSTSYPKLEIALSDEGVSVFRKKVIAEVKACLASKALDPGCGMALAATTSSGASVKDGSVVRTADASAQAKWETLKPTVNYSTPNIVSASDFGSFSVNAECNNGNGWQSCELYGGAKGLRWPTASIDLNDPDLTVHWDYH